MILHNIDWQTYSRLLRIFAERPSVRLAYDRGDLEIMSPLPEHEWDADMLGRFVVVLTEELGLPILSGGSTTLRLRKKLRGIEPDKCYWMANEPQIRGKRRLDFRFDPPPDLGLEVDVTSSSLNRMGIYAALKVPEVWRLDDESTLSFQILQADGTYAPNSHSLAFPLLTPAELLAFLSLRDQEQNSVVRQFREWLRQRLAGGATTP